MCDYLIDYIISKDIYLLAFISFYDELWKIKKKEMEDLKKKKDVKIIEVYKLLIHCKYIEFDISCYRSMIQNTEYMNKKKETKDKIEKVRQELKISSEQKYNYREEFDKWFDHPDLLYLLQTQYDVYHMEIFQLYEQNQDITWKLLKEETTFFFEFIKKNTLRKISTSYSLLETYEKKYSETERLNFLNHIKNSSANFQNQSLLSFLSSTKENFPVEQKKRFKELKESQFIAYEMITIYARVSSIEIGRNVSYMTVKKNIIELNRNKYQIMKKYYSIVKSNLININGIIPYCIFWDTKTLDSNIDILIRQNQEIINATEQEIKDMDIEIKKMEGQYKNTVDVLIPEISESGIVKTCNTITMKELEEEEEDIPNIENETNKKEFFQEFYSHENKALEREWEEQLSVFLKEYLHDNELDKIKNKPFLLTEMTKQVENWIISGNNNSKNSLLQCIVNALNGQLILDEEYTMNYYARRPYLDQYYLHENPRYYKDEDGYDIVLPPDRANENKFTETQLRELIKDQISVEIFDAIIKDVTLFIEKNLIPYFLMNRSKYKTRFKDKHPELFKEFENKFKSIWIQYKYLFIFNNDNLNIIDYEEFIGKFVDDTNDIFTNKATTKDQKDININDYFNTKKGEILVTLEQLKERIIKTDMEINNEYFIYIIEKTLKIKIISIKTNETNSFYDFNEIKKIEIKKDFIEKEIKRPIFFRSNKTDKEENKIEKGFVNNFKITGDLTQELGDYLNVDVDKMTFSLEFAGIEIIYFLKMFERYSQKTYDFYEKHPEAINLKDINIFKTINDIIYIINALIHNININGIFVVKFIYKILPYRIYKNLEKLDDHEFYDNEELKKKWSKIFNSREKREEKDASGNIIEKKTELEWLKDYLKDIWEKLKNFKIKFMVQNKNYENFEISQERILSWDQQILNIKENMKIPSTEYRVNMSGDKVDSFLFLFCDNSNNMKPVYYNLYKENEKKKFFIYEFENIPDILTYLVFFYFFKFDDNILNIFMYSADNNNFYGINKQFKKKMDFYLKNYKEMKKKQISTKIPLNTLEYLTKDELKLLSRQVVYGGGTTIPVNQNYLNQLKNKMTGGVGETEETNMIVKKTNPSSYYINPMNQDQNIQRYFQGTGQSNLSYYVIVDLELYPGKDGIPIGQKLILGCQSRYEKIRRSWAKLFGLVYRPSELYVPNYVPPPRFDLNNPNTTTTTTNTNPFTNLFINPFINPFMNPAMNPTMNSTMNPAMNSTMNPAMNPTMNSTMNPTMNPTMNSTMMGGGKRKKTRKNIIFFKGNKRTTRRF
jgi:hypothetical protein